MSNINNLVTKILADGRAKADSIINSAGEQAKTIVEQRIEQGEAEKEKILEKARLEGETLKAKIRSNITLELRDKKLDAKQQVIEKVLDLTLKKLRGMSVGDYQKFIRDYILSSTLNGDEVIVVPQKYSGSVELEQINKKLAAKNKLGQLKLDETGRSVSDGFLAVRDNIEMNNTFEALISYDRDNLEALIAKELF